MRTVSKYILRLAAIGGALTASLYAQQLAAGRVARSDVRSDHLCSVALLRCDDARSACVQGKGAYKFGPLTRVGYEGFDRDGDGSASGGLWASPFLSRPESSPSCCGSYSSSDRTRAFPTDAKNVHGFLARVGDISQSASNQQNPPADGQDNKSSATQGSPKHIFLVVPAFHVTYQKTFKPLTQREKFDQWLQGTYDPRGIGLYAFEAATLAYSSKDGFCGYGKDEGDYLKCFAATEADANISSFFGDFLFPVIMHQDPRYFRLGQGSFGKRLGYAISRVFVTHADSGRTVFFASALSGTVIGAAASNLYYPAQDRGFGHSLSRMGLDLGNTALFNAAAEFWPDIQQKLSHAFGRR